MTALNSWNVWSSWPVAWLAIAIPILALSVLDAVARARQLQQPGRPKADLAAACHGARTWRSSAPQAVATLVQPARQRIQGLPWTGAAIRWGGRDYWRMSANEYADQSIPRLRNAFGTVVWETAGVTRRLVARLTLLATVARAAAAVRETVRPAHPSAVARGTR